jgi:hypothetical protein
MTENEIATIVLRELQQAQGYDSDVLATKRQNALNYYNGLAPAPPTTTDPETGETLFIRNGMVSMDVADALHSLMAQIQPIVKTTSVEFEPETEQDEPQAQAESDLVRKIIEREGGFAAMFGACHDAFLIGNGWLKIEVEESTEVTELHYPKSIGEHGLYVISQPVDDKETRKVEDDSESDTYDVYVTRTDEKLQFRAIPPENMVFSNQLEFSGVQSLRFVGEVKAFTTSQLVAMGHTADLVDTLPDFKGTETQAQKARQGIYQQTGPTSAAQDAERLKEVYICYLRIDENDGYKSELREIWVSGTTILEDEPASYIPYVTGSAIPHPHRPEGFGLYELLASIQDGKTHVLRQYMDNLAVANLGRVGAVEGQVNMNDLLNGRINGVVRMRNPTAVVPLPSTDIGPQAMAGLNYLDHIRTQRVGSAVDFNEAQAQLMASSATAAAGQLAKVEQMAGWFANNLVETLVKPAFMMVHRMLREELAGPISAKLRGQWVQMDTRAWPARKNITITLGMTTMERAAKVSALAQLAQQQQQLISLGADGVLVDFSRFYNSMADWIRANNLGNPDEYLIDPTSPQAMQAQQGKAMQAQAQQRALEQMQAQLVQMQHHFELTKQENDLRFKYYDANLNAQVEEAKMTADGIVKIQTSQPAGTQGAANAA